MNRFYLLGLLLVILCASLGELARLPFGPGNGLLANDLILSGLLSLWLFDKIFIKRTFPPNKLWAPTLTFLIIAGISLLHGSRFITLEETIKSSLYLFRFTTYLGVLFIAHDVARNPQHKKTLFHALIGGGVFLAIAGFIQLKIMPDFHALALSDGWDPHVGRLLSTWFDPNFVGGLFAFILTIIAAHLLSPEISKKQKAWLTLSGIIILYALLLTYSRSAYLAFLGGIGTLSLLKSRKLLISVAILSILLISISPRAQERVTNLYYTGLSLVGIGAELPDATARLRLDSWNGAITIINDQPFFGVGYNTYAYAQNRYGLLDDLKKHSATGSDSTLLTIWATTGLFGLMAYLWLLSKLLAHIFTKPEEPLTFGWLSGIIGLLVHSLFVNSLLFMPLLVFVYTSAGLMICPSKHFPSPAPPNFSG